jgi:hypothetical protein
LFFRTMTEFFFADQYGVFHRNLTPSIGSDEDISRYFKEQPLYIPIAVYLPGRFFPIFYKGLLCHVAGQFLVTRPVIDIVTNRFKMTVERIFKFFPRQLLHFNVGQN